MKYLVVAFLTNVKNAHCAYSLCFCNSLKDVRKATELFMSTGSYRKIVYYSQISFIKTQ